MIDSRCVREWLSGCPRIRDMFFRCGRVDDGDTLLSPVDGGETVLRRFLNGSEERRCRFGLVRFAPAVDAPNDASAFEAQSDIDALSGWIEACERAGDYPGLPEGCRAIEVGVIGGDGAILARPAGAARYTLTFYIDYLYDPASRAAGGDGL